MSHPHASKPFPDNGFTDAAGRLTPAAHAAIDEFFAAYPIPLKALVSKRKPKSGRSKGGVYGWVMGLINSCRLAAEDVDAEIRLAVSAGIRRFDPVKAAAAGGSLTSYLVWWVFNAAERVASREQAAARLKTVAISGGADDDQYDNLISPEAIPDTRPDGVDEMEPYGVLQAAVDGLPVRLRDVVRMKVECGLTNVEVGEAYGFTKQWADGLFKQAKAAVADRCAARLGQSVSDASGPSGADNHCE